jgi:hypothetical protein
MDLENLAKELHGELPAKRSEANEDPYADDKYNPGN